jgi:hypothetical protein
MQWLARKSGPDTFSVFHFSGHTCIASRGPCAAGHYYLWAYDNRMLSEQAVGSLLDRVRGRAWFDYMGCEAAGVVRSLAAPGRLVTASSRADEKSYERRKWQESVWVRLAWHRGLLNGRADRNGNGRVSILEAVHWAKRSAPEVTAAQQPYGPQHPVILGGTGRGWRLDAPRIRSH